jgi:hypothetical protein
VITMWYTHTTHSAETALSRTVVRTSGRVNKAIRIELSSWLLDQKSIPSSKRGYAKSFSRNADNVLLYRKTATVVPSGPLQLRYLEFFHDRLDRGHFGFTKTFASMQSRVYWPTMNDDITNFIASCEICQRSKKHKDMNHGLLHPLPIPDERFQSINIDFASMPRSSAGNNSMMVICDRLTKLGELVSTKDTLTAKTCAELLYTHWFLNGKGFPESIVSDRDSRDSRFSSFAWLSADGSHAVKEYLVVFCMTIGIVFADSDLASHVEQNLIQ